MTWERTRINPSLRTMMVTIFNTCLFWCSQPGGWEGGGDSHIKVTGVIVGNFEKGPVMVPE